jgi:hypothetical protein
MRLLLSLVLSVAACMAANPSIDGNRFLFTGIDGGACLEFTSAVSFRLVRWWGPAAPVLGDPVYKDRLWTQYDDRVSLVAIDTKFLKIETGKDDYRLTVKLPSGRVLWSERRGVYKSTDGAQLIFDSNITADEKLYGFGAPVRKGSLDQRGQKFRASSRPLYFSSGGYGRFLARTGQYDVDASEAGRVRIAGTGLKVAEQYFYYGPTPKEILEQHTLATQSQVNHPDTLLDLMNERDLPTDVVRIPVAESNYCDFSLLVNQSSLSGTVYQALDISKLGKYLDELRMYPILYRSDPATGGSEIEVRRKTWIPYLRTYLREAYDRGLPFLRPLVMQYARDKGMETRSDVFMVGDELLVAPGCDVKSVELPRGRWTDLRTNKLYPGRTVAPNEAPGMPVFAKMGSILPLVPQRKDVGLELHYYPNIGAEFFLIEPEVGEYSQFHAAPVGDIMRVESESKIERTCEWILHHMDTKPKTVGESNAPYREVSSRGELVPGTWFYDAAQHNLHLMLHVKAGEDRIVNSTF